MDSAVYYLPAGKRG